MTIIIIITTIIITKADFLVRLYIITRSIYRKKITAKVIIIVINICIYIYGLWSKDFVKIKTVLTKLTPGHRKYFEITRVKMNAFKICKFKLFDLRKN